MKKIVLFLVLFSASALVYAQLKILAGVHPPPTVHAKYTRTSGVSLELSKQRKAILSRIHYTIALNIPGTPKEPIRSSEQISFDLSSTGADLEVDFKENPDKLLSLKINGKQDSVRYEQEHIIIPQKTLIKGNNNIEIEFIAGDGSLNRQEEFLYTLLVPAHARTFIPCFDQPDLKALFTLTATVPSGWEAISNGKIIDTATTGNRKTYHFTTSDTISTYLFSLVAGKFKRASRKIANREFNFYYRETDTARINQNMDSIFILNSAALHFMENYTGIAFPFQKFDFIAIPDFQFSGMEHVGAIYYRARNLFLDKSPTLKNVIDRIHLIAHETAHMWFGDLVSIKWFNDVWMKEVFANFMADKFLDLIMPDANSDCRFLLDHHLLAYNVERTKGANPVRQELNNLDQANSLYGNIIYHKAPIIMKQLEKTTGAEIMQKGLREYLKTYSNKNAAWPDLIAILDRISTEDIQGWNDQWINKKGRPVITYEMNAKNGLIDKFVISQKGERGMAGIWKEHFTVALVYNDSVKILPVNMAASSLTLKSAYGLAAPLFVLFNATGEGYGSFPVDRNMLKQIMKLKRPVMRASAYINIYEKVLDGEVMSPRELLDLYGENVNSEPEELIVDKMLTQFRNIYWQFILPAEREQLCTGAESNIWLALQNAASVSKKKLLLQNYYAIALSNDAIEKVYQIWKTEKAPGGIKLSEDDYTTIAGELAIRKHPQTPIILEEQLKRIKNNDRRERFKFLQDALSNDTNVRAAFFNSLSNAANRKNEVWVTAALGYLFHPLRAGESEKYLLRSLELLREVDSTGNIFFSSNWLAASFGNYQSKNAADIVTSFLQMRPHYDELLKGKILQEADDLFRARKILGERQ